jgi:ribosome-associated toxin RatA of RatAB toxin-antitoxin module
MQTIERIAEVTYTPQEMYDLVNDVTHYHDFIPFCSESKLISETADERIGALTFLISGLTQTVTTRNRLVAPASIEVWLVSGPFKSLHGLWRFDQRPEGARVHLTFSFEFASPLIRLMFGQIFAKIIDELVDCFIKRAERVYGH